jgi:hypothetical protein
MPHIMYVLLEHKGQEAIVKNCDQSVTKTDKKVTSMLEGECMNKERTKTDLSNFPIEYRQARGGPIMQCKERLEAYLRKHQVP